jgi:hypothetical protein
MASRRHHTVAGYPRLSDQIGRQPEFGIYRSFAALHAQDLLYMQAELVEVENELRSVEKVDSESADNYRKLYSSDWWFLEHAANRQGLSDHDAAFKQRDILRRMRPLLKQYSRTTTGEMIFY